MATWLDARHAVMLAAGGAAHAAGSSAAQPDEAPQPPRVGLGQLLDEPENQNQSNGAASAAAAGGGDACSGSRPGAQQLQAHRLGSGELDELGAAAISYESGARMQRGCLPAQPAGALQAGTALVSLQPGPWRMQTCCYAAPLLASTGLRMCLVAAGALCRGTCFVGVRF